MSDSNVKKAAVQKDETHSVELPILSGTQGPDVLDVQALFKNTGYFTYDPGFMSTASCQSAITYIDGEKGVLEYRGYPIEQLAEKSTYLEVCYLLMKGDLPTKAEKAEFIKFYRTQTMVHEQLRTFFNGFRRDAHPMAVMVGVVGALSAFYHDKLDMGDPKQREIAATKIIAKMPTIAAMAYKYSIGQPFVYPDNNLKYSENFLRMMFSVPAEDYTPNPVIAKAMDQIFILHADHEQNASTSTVRLAGSSGANPFACTAAGIASLWGPAHGGANQAVLEMLEEIGSVENIPAFIEKVKDKSSGVRLMGFGHRVYKNFDPRATLLRERCHEVLKEVGKEDDELLKIAMKLEEIALEDEYFKDRKLYPNVDFYSGIILKAIGIPVSMFTVIFAMSRAVGWISHWLEMMGEDTQKIGRPRQLYTGAKTRDYVPMDKR